MIVIRKFMPCVAWVQVPEEEARQYPSYGLRGSLLVLLGIYCFELIYVLFNYDMDRFFNQESTNVGQFILASMVCIGFILARSPRSPSVIIYAEWLSVWWFWPGPSYVTSTVGPEAYGHIAASVIMFGKPLLVTYYVALSERVNITYKSRIMAAGKEQEIRVNNDRRFGGYPVPIIFVILVSVGAISLLVSDISQAGYLSVFLLFMHISIVLLCFVRSGVTILASVAVFILADVVDYYSQYSAFLACDEGGVLVCSMGFLISSLSFSIMYAAYVFYSHRVRETYFKASIGSSSENDLKSNLKGQKNGA